jgi:hypothetical protein
VASEWLHTIYRRSRDFKPKLTDFYLGLPLLLDRHQPKLSAMRLHLTALISLAALTSACLAPSFETCLAQSVQSADDSHTGVVIAELSQPVYPPLARTAYIYGDVNLLLHVKEDGKVDSAAVVSGPRCFGLPRWRARKNPNSSVRDVVRREDPIR